MKFNLIKYNSPNKQILYLLVFLTGSRVSPCLNSIEIYDNKGWSRAWM